MCTRFPVMSVMILQGFHFFGGKQYNERPNREVRALLYSL